MTDRLEDQHTERRQHAVAIAVLETKVEALTSTVSELRELNVQQSIKLDQMLTQMAEARGGLRTTLWFGGAMATFGGAIAWALEHLTGKHP